MSTSKVQVRSESKEGETSAKIIIALSMASLTDKLCGRLENGRVYGSKAHSNPRRAEAKKRALITESLFGEANWTICGVKALSGLHDKTQLAPLKFNWKSTRQKYPFLANVIFAAGIQHRCA